MFSPLDEAKYRTVHAFRSGAERLATLAGMRYGTLCNKVNPAMESHHLTVDEAVTLQHITQDFRILHAMATVLNHACVPLGDYGGCSDVELLDLYADYHARVGAMAQTIRDALADGEVTRPEFEAVRGAFNGASQAGLAVLARLEALADG